MRRLAVINQKGGVGKTTTAANLGSAMGAAGRRVLLVDLDPQAHLTMCYGIEPGQGGEDKPNIYDCSPIRFRSGRLSLTSALTSTSFPHISTLPVPRPSWSMQSDVR